MDEESGTVDVAEGIVFRGIVQLLDLSWTNRSLNDSLSRHGLERYLVKMGAAERMRRGACRLRYSSPGVLYVMCQR